MDDIFYPLHPDTVRNTGHAEASATRAANAADQVRQVERYMEEEFARLHLACRAMWEIVRLRTGSTDDDLLRMMEAVDLSDGKLDGKVSVDVENCGNCDRRMGKRHPKCIYCGTPRTRTEPF